VTEIDLLLRALDSDREVWRGPLPSHAHERLIADTHMAAILAGVLPNNGAAVRVDELSVEAGQGRVQLRVAVGAGSMSFTKTFSSESLRDDAETTVTRLLAAEVLPQGTYRFSPAARVPASDNGTRLSFRPLPRRLGRFAERSLWDCGLTSLPACRHPAILLPRRHAQQMLEQARAAAEVEVGAVLVVEPFIIQEMDVGCRLGIPVVDVAPLGHGTEGARMKLRVTPEALAEVRVVTERGQWCGGMAHSHPFGGEQLQPHFLSSEDKAMACGFFWLPFQIQLIIDPRFAVPEDALAAFCWIDGALARVCFNLIEG